MRKTQKSKKFYLFGIVLVLSGILIGGYLVLKSKTGTADISEQFSDLLKRETEISQEITKFSQADDLDKDGLANWQEEIYGTDPNNPDTDGDSYLDGEEIISGYDPLVPAPNDALSGQAEIPRPLSQNLTRLLAQNMAPQIGQLESDSFDIGNMLEQTQKDEALQNQLAAFFKELWPEISQSELIIIDDNSQMAQDKYFEQVIQAIPETPIESEEEVLTQAMTTGDFSQIDFYINVYRTAVPQMKKIPTPSNFVPYHKRIIELLMGTEKVYQAIKEINQDPFKTTLALQENQKIRRETLDLLNQFVDLLMQSK